MAAKRLSVKRFPGVYCRQSEIRPPVEGRPDQCFDISYKDLRGKKIWEKIGWKSEGITAAYASQIRAERIRNIRLGDENVTVQQKKTRAVTLSECAKNYFTWARNNTKGEAQEANRFDKHIEPALGDKPLHDITPDDIENLKTQLAQKSLKPKSIHLILSLIRTIYNKAISDGLYDGPVPTKKVNFPKVNNRRLRFLSHEEAIKLLNALTNRSKQLHDEALIALHCGLRFGEIAALTWHDLNFKNEIIQIRNPKNGESRMAFMTPHVKKMLRGRHLAWEKKRATDDDASKDNKEQFVFPDIKGGKQKEVSRTFERVVNDLGFNAGLNTKDSAHKVVFHSLRHSFASWLAIQGTPLYTIKELMGHKNITMTERYSHLTPDHKKMAIQSMAKVFSNIGKTSKKKAAGKQAKPLS